MKSAEFEFSIDPRFLPPEPLWQAVEPLLPEQPPKPKGGRPRMPDRQAFFAIFYLLHTGCQWNALPRSLGASSTVHDRFEEWVRADVFEQLWRTGLLEFDISVGLCWTWQSLDGAMTKAPLGGEATGANPTDRGKSGTKRHMLCEGHGLPIAAVVTGANRHDKTQVEAVLQSMPLAAPLATQEYPQHFCGDKGYDYDDVRLLIFLWGYIDHIKSRADERAEKRPTGGRARRWVCERTHSWINRFRRLLIRWEKNLDNYLGLLHLACATIVWRNCPVFG
jgi:putative transposase